ncbi:MAG: hypothetical protein KY476_16645 [Planctomycetes bacterium]|nr:hypothetical protein [Planctomycetota bacterium]
MPADRRPVRNAFGVRGGGVRFDFPGSACRQSPRLCCGDPVGVHGLGRPETRESRGGQKERTFWGHAGLSRRRQRSQRFLAAGNGFHADLQWISPEGSPARAVGHPAVVG